MTWWLLVHQTFGSIGKRTDYNYTCVGRRQVPIEGPLVRIGWDILLHDDDRFTEMRAVQIATAHRLCFVISQQW